MALQEKIWTVAEAKARLSELLRLADDEGPQRIGLRRSFIVVPADVWDGLTAAQETRPPMGRWLLENMPRGVELEAPSRAEAGRAIPFADDAGA